MPTIRFTKNLLRFYPGLQPVELEGATVAEVLRALDQRFPGLAAYFIDDQGALREHVNVFIGEQLIHDRVQLSDPVQANDQIYFMQALSGG